LQILDAHTGKGLPKLLFSLYRDSKRSAAALSDAEGCFQFKGLVPGAYTMIQETYPTKRRGLSIQYAIRVDETGTARIGGEPACGFRLFNFERR
jgi:hypothetical protein